MSKKRILNLTATKKRDNLAYYDPSNVTTTGRVISSSDSAELFVYNYCPTARQYENSDDPTDRSRHTVFWKGVREVGSMTTSSAVPWEWRRIVFEAKGLRPESTHGLTSNGYRRVAAPFFESETLAPLFEGDSGDFSRFMDGKVDTQQVKLHYDKKIVLRSGNDNIHFHQYKHYFPLNSNMYYADDEDRQNVISNNWCSNSRAGMGNLFILDMFRCCAEGTHQLAWRPTATAYWHEK